MGLILGSGGKGGRRGRRSLNAEINVTPFVDVMLVLLIVFMVTAPMLVRGEQLNLPRTTSAPIKSDPNDA
ncbi:biopolymer transporter ExbD, partial [Escherichia coli]